MILLSSFSFLAALLLATLPAAADTGVSNVFTIDLRGAATDTGVSNVFTIDLRDAAPVASFTFSPSAPKAGDVVAFSDTSAGSPTLWLWDFGDAATGSGKNVTHRYPTAGTYGVKLTVSNVSGSSSVTDTVQVTSSSGCKPATPQFTSVPPGAVLAGDAFTLSWSHVLASDPNGSYQVDRFNGACGVGLTRYVTTEPRVTIPTEPGQTIDYCAVVRAVSSANCVGDDSAPVTIRVRPAPASFIVFQDQRPEGVAVAGSPPPTGETVVFKNIGGGTADLSVRSVRGFFTPSPRLFPGVAPGQTATVGIQFDSYVTAAPAFFSDALVGQWTDGGVTREVSTAVTLTVLSSPRTTLSQGSRLQLTPSNEIHFVKPAGDAPPPQVITVRNSGTATVRLAYSIGPGGAWLSISGDHLSPIPAGGTRTFTLGADRAKRSDADGRPPITTYLTFTSVDGLPTDRAVLQLFDEEPTPTVSGANRSAIPAGDASLVFGSTVGLKLSDREFVSDGWVRNKSGAVTTVDLYYTPDGDDGLTGGVKKSTLTLQPHGTYRLADFVRGLGFVDAAGGGTGHVEIRSAGISELSARTTADALTVRAGALARYGAEIPTVRSLEGAAMEKFGGAPLVLAGVKGGKNSRFRTNVILAETSGSPLQALVKLIGEDGSELARTSKAVPPYSKVQINYNDARLFPLDVNFDGASLEVEPVGGAGSVAAFATVLDNTSQGYTTRSGRFVAEMIATATEPETGTRRPQAASISRLVIPAVAHAVGRNDTFFRTAVTIRNGVARNATLTMAYLPDDGTSVTPETITIPPRGSKTFADVLGSPFGYTANTAGMLVITGDIGRVVVSSDTSTQIDLNDPTKGISPSTVPAYSPESPEAVGNQQKGALSAVVSHPGLEESFRFRTNLVLAEVSGLPVKVRVKVVPPGAKGATLAQQEFDLAPFQRKQIGSFIPAIQGLPTETDLLQAQYLDMETIVEWVSGDGRAIALATKIDNDPASKRIDAYVLGPSGKQQGSIGF